MEFWLQKSYPCCILEREFCTLLDALLALKITEIVGFALRLEMCFRASSASTATSRLKTSTPRRNEIQPRSKPNTVSMLPFT
jgi:hypothetical protein